MERKLSGVLKSTSKEFVFITLLILVYLTRFYNFLLFHTIAEFFSIVIASCIFLITWHVRDKLNNNFLISIGLSLLFVGLIDFVHTLAYKNMNIFTGYDANLPTQLWIAARFYQSISFLVSIWLLKRKIRPETLFVIYLAAFCTIMIIIFPLNMFPVCFIEGSGLTAFKIYSEYIISILLIMGCFSLYRNRKTFDNSVVAYLLASILFTIGAELAFTFYVGVFDFSNVVGHLFKIVSYYILYKALIETGLIKPYALLFRNLADRERELEKSLKEVKHLKGLLPICSVCKKIKDDKNHWHQIEQYIDDQLEVKFSHSYCPECAEKIISELDQMESIINLDAL